MEEQTVQGVKEKITLNIYKVIPNPNRTKSDIWALFGVVVDALTCQEVGYVACKTCSHVLKMKQGCGTSTMKRHREKCEGLTPPVVNRNRIPPDPHAKASFKEACVNYCAQDLRPFSSIDGAGMRGLLQKAIDIGAAHALRGAGTVNVGDLVPDTTHMPDDVKAETKKCRQELAPKIKDAIEREGCAVTTDLWTDNHRKLHYMTLTAHFINEGWEIECHPLITTHFDDEETGENIKRFMVEIMEKEFQISEEELAKITFVTDNGANVRKALENFRRLYCMTHGLNICVRGALSVKYGELVERCLKGNSKAQALVNACDAAVRFVKNESRNKNPGDAQLKKKLCASKKHIGSYSKMLKSLNKNFKEVTDFLQERGREFMLTGVEYESIEELIDFLDPIDLDGSRENSPNVTQLNIQ